METGNAKMTLTVNEAAEQLGIHPKSLKRELAEGRLRCIRIGARVLIPVAELNRFLEEAMEKWTPAEIGRGAIKK